VCATAAVLKLWRNLQFRRAGWLATALVASHRAVPLPLQFLAAWLAVWFARALQHQVDYLMAENRILGEKLGHQKLRLTDADRRRLAVHGKELGRKLLAKVSKVKCETLHTDPEIFEVWAALVVAAERLCAFEAGAPVAGRPQSVVTLLASLTPDHLVWEASWTSSAAS